jgi:polar amino acid transport system substrate-binding protein
LPFIRKPLFFTTLLLVLIFIALVSKPAISSSSQPTNVKLQLFWHHQFEFAGFYAAISQGYFDKYNINVELIKFDPTVNEIDLVLKGEVQFGLAGTEIIDSYHQGKDVMLLASYFKRSPLIIITQPEITSLKQLKNKKIFGLKQHIKQGSIRSMLNFFDVEPSEIDITMEGELAALFKNKAIAGILTYRTSTRYQLNQKKIKYRMYDPNQFGIASQDLNLFTTGKFAKENKELVKNFTLAASEGWNYAIQHPNEIIDLIKSQYNIQNLTEDALKFEANETIKLISPELFEVGSIQRNKLTTISEESYANKSISSIKNLDNFVFQLNEGQKIDSQLLKSLTSIEKQYLKEHPIIRIQNENDYPPFNYSVNEVPTGYSIDYIKLLTDKMGVNIHYIQHKSWQEYLEMLRVNKLDAMVNIMETDERKELYNFTTPFAEPNNVAVTRNSDFDNVIDGDLIKNKRLVVVNGYAASDKYEKLYPTMNVIKVRSVLEALKAIIDKEADIFISNDAVINFYIEKHYITGLKFVPLAKDLKYPNTLLSIATNINNPVLTKIFQKAMSTIAEHEVLALRKRWLGDIKTNNKTLVNLTQFEKEYLFNNPVIRVQNDGDYPPFNYLIDGKPTGYSIDLINLIATMLGVKVELIKGKSWTEYTTMLKRKELDVLINITDLESRHDFAGFTSPYVEISTFAASRKYDFNDQITKENLPKKRIAIAKGYAINETLKESLAQSVFILVNNTSEALKLISTNQADIYFEAGAVFDYYMTKNIMTNLQLLPVSADLEVVNQNFSIATHKENKTLLNILQKTINAIPDIEQVRLKRKWFGNMNKKSIDNEIISNDELAYIKRTTVTLCRPELAEGATRTI